MRNGCVRVFGIDAVIESADGAVYYLCPQFSGYADSGRIPDYRRAPAIHPLREMDARGPARDEKRLPDIVDFVAHSAYQQTLTVSVTVEYSVG